MQALDEARERASSRRAPNPAARIPRSEMAVLQSRIAQAEAALDAARVRERELARALEVATSSVQTLPPIDLIIALDTTNNMSGEVASLREAIAGLSELLIDLTEDRGRRRHRLQGRMRQAAGVARRPATANRRAIGAAARRVRTIDALRVDAL